MVAVTLLACERLEARKKDNEIQFNALLMNDSGEGFLGLQAEYDEEKDELYLANDMREYFNNKDLQESYFSKI